MRQKLHLRSTISNLRLVCFSHGVMYFCDSFEVVHALAFLIGSGRELGGGEIRTEGTSPKRD